MTNNTMCFDGPFSRRGILDVTAREVSTVGIHVVSCVYDMTRSDVYCI